MANTVKRLLSRLPVSWQQELRRWRCWREIRSGRTPLTEPEAKLLLTLVWSGNLVIDIGANVGYYTALLSDLVGRDGRVIAIEPVPDTFAILASNVMAFRNRNVTLLNVAASDAFSMPRISVPLWSTGIPNWCEAAISANGSGTPIVAIPLDGLNIDRRVSLIKLDTEGHELATLRGFARTIQRDKPTLIVETADGSEAVRLIESWGYSVSRLPGSPNVVCRPITID
jgi:FkbM family methyltransferase